MMILIEMGKLCICRDLGLHQVQKVIMSSVQMLSAFHIQRQCPDRETGCTKIEDRTIPLGKEGTGIFLGLH